MNIYAKWIIGASLGIEFVKDELGKGVIIDLLIARIAIMKEDF